MKQPQSRCKVGKKTNRTRGLPVLDTCKANTRFEKAAGSFKMTRFESPTVTPEKVAERVIFSPHFAFSVAKARKFGAISAQLKFMPCYVWIAFTAFFRNL
jgi:hypothetical protein